MHKFTPNLSLGLSFASTGRTVLTLMNAGDMRYLVESIWRNQSLLSEERDLKKLVLARWDVNAVLTPWNCVLLTGDEAKAHAMVSCARGS